MMNPDRKTILEVEDLCVEFHTPSGVVHAVSHSSFKLHAGETLGIVGESGSGKSVTANAIMRLLPDTAKVTGSIRFKGQDIMQMKTKDFNRIRGKEISMIFQDPMTSLNPLYTVGNQLEEVLTLHMGLKGDAAKKRAIELLDMVAIPQPETRIKQYPHEFSGGMRQRVMIAMALACDPTILIADEPTTALDVTIQAQILELMKELQKKVSTAIIMITHDLGIVSDLCDRVNVMYGSQIMESGTVDDLFYETAHPLQRRACCAACPRRCRIWRTSGCIRSWARRRFDDAAGGCAFAARCENCMKLCLNRRPELVPAGNGHTSRCWLTALDNAAKEVRA